MVKLEQGLGLERLVVSNDAAEAVVYPQGAHVAQWTPRGRQPVLFLSSRSRFEAGKAIRGGIPVIFPWFGARGGGLPGPAHGWARTALWKLRAQEEEAGATTLELDLDERDGMQASYQVVIGTTLSLTMTVRNVSDAPVVFENALHTYFHVSDVSTATITGLEDTRYLDKTENFAKKPAAGAPLQLAGETDSVYNGTSSQCQIHDPGLGRSIRIAKSGSASTVVWNPWHAKASAMEDMGPGEWQRMLCVESGNIGPDAVTLGPGSTHSLQVVIELC
jgi:glucose-6-phosphate 1-epimerase